MSTCPKCHRPFNEGNSPNAAECNGTDDDEGLCEAYALVAALRVELASVQEALDEADADCSAHNLYTVEESLRASRAISAAEGDNGPHTVFASMRDRIWWLVMEKELVRLRKDSARLAWLHTGSGKDPEGYEWGVARIKHDANGQVVSALWTLSDHSDLDAEMSREGGS